MKRILIIEGDAAVREGLRRQVTGKSVRTYTNKDLPAASFMPPVPEGSDRVSSNDVFVDGRGLIYLIDRKRGLHILERV